MGVFDEPDAEFFSAKEDLEGRQQQQAKETFSIRLAMTEMHLSLLLHTMRASRIALKSSEITREERRLALDALDKKERRVRSDMDAVTARREERNAVTLQELHE